MPHLLFPSQQENEKIHLVLREHPVRLALILIVWFMFALLLVLFKTYMPEVLPALFEGEAGTITTLFTQVYTLFLTVALFIIFLIYYLNVQIITNLRIVDIDQVGLFSHVVSELHIENIEDITSETNGILGTVFDYGMVYVQTAGTQERFEFNNIPHPAAVEKLILDLYEQHTGGKSND